MNSFDFLRDYVLLAPLNACRWAAGRGWSASSHDSKPSYGGTSDAELGEKAEPN